MMRSLFSGVAGIKVHQTRMDVIGNNIANINTIGFKSSRTTFSDMLSQTQSAASAPTDTRGGINARQIGLGVNVESIDLLFTDSSSQSTGRNTDLALAGNGLFYLKDGNQSYYTRNGSFMFDEDGNYVMSGTGLRVQGWNATSEGVINNNGAATDINVPVGKTMEATATTSIAYSGNLNKESSIIKSISYTASTSSDADATKVVTTDTSYSTSVTITAPDGYTLNGTNPYSLSGSTEYAADADVSSELTATYRQGTQDTASGNYFYDIIYKDSTGNVVATATSTTALATAPTGTPTVTATAADASTLNTDITSVNVDGTNVVAATITFRDDTTMTVTSGYYEVGRSVPITTLATIYDSLGGQHEVTLLIDKDSASTDDGLSDSDAQATAREIYTYTADGTSHTLTKGTDDDGNVTYSYTVNGTTYNVDAADVTTSIAYDNRWRMYIAPGTGEAGPASENFANTYTRSEANGNAETDGSSTTGTMNGSYENSKITYLYFNDKGAFISNGRTDDASITFEYSDGNGAASNQAVLDFSGLTQYANSTTSFPTSNGNAAGVLQSVAVDSSGIISGSYTNGLIRQEAQIAVAQFTNSAGLTKVGTTIYTESNNSGTANIRTIEDFGLSVTASALEMSNVDLATEFSEMIITQRGFQANSKMTTVSDEMLETLVNMKR